MTARKQAAAECYANLVYMEALLGKQWPEEKAKLLAVIQEPDLVPCAPSQLPDAVCKGRR